MSKKHARSSSGNAKKTKDDRKHFNDPDFAGKKAVKSSSRTPMSKSDQPTIDNKDQTYKADPQGDKSSQAESQKKTNNESGTADKSESSEKTGKPLERRNKKGSVISVSAKSLHNKDIKDQTATKKPPLPDEFKIKQEEHGEPIIVKTGKKPAKNLNSSKTQKSTKQSSNLKKPKKTEITPKTALEIEITDATKNTAKTILKVASKTTPPKTTPKITSKIPHQTPPEVKVSDNDKPGNSKKFDWRKHPMPAILRIPCLIFLLAGAAILFTWFIFWRTNSCDATVVADFIGRKPELFTYSCIIIFFLMSVIAAITWHVFFTIGFSFAAASILTFISMQKFELREEPLLPSDFVFAGQTGNLIGMVDAGAIWRLVIGVILILIGSVLLEIYVCKMLGKRLKGLPWWEKYSLIPRATYTTVAVTGLVMVTGPIFRHENPEWLHDFTAVAWDQTQTFGHNGFILDFVSNMRKTAAAKPAGYGPEAIREIAEKYQAIKEADDENRKPLDEIADQIFIILDESFYDPSIIKDYYDYGNKDVLPTVHKIFKKYPSGYMYSPGYGGSTANIEFEVQTGYSNYWANSYPYIDVVSKSGSVLSAANWAKKYGFNTQAVHAYWGNMYSRSTAYPILGYDDFVDMDEMTIRRYEPGTAWPNDNAIFDEALDLTDGRNPILVNIVTMQNHAGYTSQNYPYLEYRVKNGSRKDEISTYYQLLNATDEYLDDLITKLESSKERSVILWFGDHAAGIFPELAESENKSERDLTRLTPYFIWANFDLESDTKKALTNTAKKNQELGFDFSMVEGVDLPTTTPNCLLNQLYNTLGAEKPAFFYLLDAVCEDTPIITGAYYTNNQIPVSDILREYELVNYDIMNGYQYWDGE